MRTRTGITNGTTTSPVVAVALVALSTLLAMSAWFSATFVVPQLRATWDLTPSGTAALTIAVQLGFVLGALLSAATGIADAVPGRVLMFWGAVGAAACNASLLLCGGLGAALPLRVATGICLAGVYPPAIKEVSTWFLKGRGKALGIMIGALTLGSALPHLVAAVGGVEWRLVIVTTSILSASGGLVVLLVRGEGPHPFPRRPVSLAAGFRSLGNRDVALANAGYAGHMWELYAMWAALGLFLGSLPEVARRSDAESMSAQLAFVCIGVGAAGCLVGGMLGDRWGRPRAAMTALICSGGTAVALAVFYPVLPLAAVILLCAFWGFWVIADSAQFSAMVTETADPDYIGGALSVQLALGFVVTMLTLWGVPQAVEHYSWRVALLILAIGPAVGIVAMVAAESRRRESAVIVGSSTPLGTSQR